MSASGCLPLCERALRVERPGYHRMQKTGWQDYKWSSAGCALLHMASRLLGSVPKIDLLLCGIWF